MASLVKAEGYGFADVEHRVPARPDTVFKIGSVSKQFIATGIMLLVQDGKLAVGDKVSKYLAGTPATWEAITLRHLLTHTSGIVREAPGFDPYKLQPEIAVIETAYPLPLRFTPGEKYEYCNVGYFVLAEIIHSVSGKPWADFLERARVRSAGDDRDAGDNARGHRPEPRPWLRVAGRHTAERGRLARGASERRFPVDRAGPGEVGGGAARRPDSEGTNQEGNVDAGDPE